MPLTKIRHQINIIIHLCHLLESAYRSLGYGSYHIVVRFLCVFHSLLYKKRLSNRTIRQSLRVRNKGFVLVHIGQPRVVARVAQVLLHVALGVV